MGLSWGGALWFGPKSRAVWEQTTGIPEGPTIATRTGKSIQESGCGRPREPWTVPLRDGLVPPLHLLETRFVVQPSGCPRSLAVGTRLFSEGPGR